MKRAFLLEAGTVILSPPFDIINVSYCVQYVNELFNYFKNNLFILANRLKLEKIDNHRNLYSTYDWSAATEFDEALSNSNPLEFIKSFFESDLFSVGD